MNSQNKTELERKFQRLQNDIRSAIPEEFYIKLRTKDVENTIKKAIVNTNAVLSISSIGRLLNTVPKHGFNDINISRSGAGLRIELKK